MNSRPFTLFVALAILFAGVLALRPLERRLRRSAAEGVSPEQLGSLGGQRGLLAVLGGMRSAVAGAFWLRAHLAWERRDSAATAAWIELSVAADERPLSFWLNGARMLAYDLPAWRRPEPAAVRERAGEAHARLALAFLEKGLRWHGADAALYIEMANLHLRRTGDLESAARCYREAAALPHAPYYAGRIHAELLRELGRPREALDGLRRMLPRLPADEPEACRAVVLARIEALEQELAGR